MRNYQRHALALLCLSAAVAGSAATTNIERNRQAEAERWADSVYNTLSERQRVAQLVFPKVVPTQGENSKAALRRLIQTEGCGGLLFTEGSLAQYADMTNYAQSVATVPVMMTFDGEWGLSMRIENTPRFPHNMALGAITDYKLLYAYGQEMARECRLAGIHVNFAPDADVNSNPANPVIGYRAFGESPDRVAKASVAYSLGLEDGGVQAVAKHFPGHGDTDSDSHKTLPAVNHNKAHLDSTDMVPFREFINAGCSGIMVGHLAVPALDSTGQPASLSQTITSKVLRNDLGFEGLVYTDALGMKGAVDNKGRNASVASLLAGADVLLSPLNPKTDIDAIVAAIKSGLIPKSVIEDRCKRVLRYKYLLCLGNTSVSTKTSELSKQINSAQAEALIKRLAAASVTILKNKDNLLPIGELTDKTVGVVNIGAKADNEFSATCRHYVRTNAHFTLGDTFSAASLAKINDNNDIVIAAIYNDSQASRNCLTQLAKSIKKPLVAVFFVNPYKMNKFAGTLSGISTLVIAYDNIAAERISAAEALFGGIEVSGRMPVNINGIAKIGDGISYPKTRLGHSSPAAHSVAPWLGDSIEALINQGLETGAFPGCQILVARGGDIIYEKAFGHLSMSKGSAKVNLNTAYDLASVSKASGTLSGIMKAYDMGLFSLEDNLNKFIPEISDPGKQSITIKELLFHETGMPASLAVHPVMFDTTSYTGKLMTTRPDRTHSIKIQKGLYGHNTARLRTDITSPHKSEKFPIEAAKGIYTGRVTYDTIMHRIYDIPLNEDKSYNYSCLNFCLLMDIEQRVTGRSHDEFVHNEVFGPLGAYRTGYRPHETIGIDNVAPTEYDSFLRRQTVHGYVHDETAAMSGGVQGNAGLFGTASDLAKMCQMLLNGGTYGDKRIISEETAHLFTTEKSPTCRRGLGYDKPDVENPDNSPTCEEASPAVFGHLGFTGTVFWVDPEKELIFVFLNNRVNPTRDNAAFSRLNIRPKLFSLVYRAIED